MHLSLCNLIFLTTSLPQFLNAFLRRHLYTISTPKSIAVLLYQWISLITLYARGEFLYTIDTQNVSTARFFIPEVIWPIVFTVSVHCTAIFHPFLWKSFDIRLASKTSSVPNLLFWKSTLEMVLFLH